MDKVELLKTKINNTNEQLNLNGRSRIVTFLNPYSYLYYRKNLNLFSQFDEINIDSISLVLLLKFFVVKTKRLSFDMTSLAPLVFNSCTNNNQKIYFVGSSKGSIAEFIKKIKEDFSNMNIIGYRNGYFRNSDERKLEINKIVEKNPDIVVVGMGTPMQEEFLLSLKTYGWDGVGYSCGGFIHQTAKDINYYPNFLNKYNLRWLYRIYDEPKLFKRYLLLYPKSIALFIFDVLKSKL